MTLKRPNVEPECRYSIKEACFHLKICRDSLAKYTSRGKIARHIDATGAYFYFGADILAFFDKLDEGKNIESNK